MDNRIGCDGRENSLEPEDRQREDRQFVESFKPLVEFLGKVCGPMTEIALHDTAEPDNSIIAIANGDVSGRQVGSPATDFMLRILHRGLAEERDYVAGYAGHSDKKDRELVSSTYFIRRRGRIVGMLCINTDQSAWEEFLTATQALQRYFPLDTTGQIHKWMEARPQKIEHDEADRPVQENLSASVDGMGERVIAAMVAKTGRQPDHFDSSERLSIIRDLDESGYFMLKGAISVIARRLGLADSSIYRYLHLVRRP